MAEKVIHNIPIVQPVMDWKALNLSEAFSDFRAQVELILIDGPYANLPTTQKVPCMLNWMGSTGQKIFRQNLSFSSESAKKDLAMVLDEFQRYFRPMHNMVQAWYALGSLYSSHCKDQGDFMDQLRHHASECEFTNPDEIVKFIFLIHNMHKRVQDRLLKDIKKDTTISGCIAVARSVEATIASEKLAEKLHQGLSLETTSIDGIRTYTPKQDLRRYEGCCRNCGRNHDPRKCPAYDVKCHACGRLGHFKHMCRSTTNSRAPHTTRKKIHDAELANISSRSVNTDTSGYEYDDIKIVKHRGSSENTEICGNKFQVDQINCHNAEMYQRTLTDLAVSDVKGVCNHEIVRFKLDTGAGGNLLPLNIFKRLHPHASDYDLCMSIDKSVTPEAYNMSNITQLGSCTVNIRNSFGNLYPCYFYIVPSKFKPILGLEDCVKLNLIEIKCPSTHCWNTPLTVNSCDINPASYVSNVARDPLRTRLQQAHLTKSDIMDSAKYKPLFQGVGKFKITPVTINIKQDATPFQSPPQKNSCCIKISV